MKHVFNFSKTEPYEQAIRETWDEFRDALANGFFTYNEVDKAKTYTFLKVYDDLFNQHLGKKYETISIGDLKGQSLGRGAILNLDEIPTHQRFVPMKEFIKDDNRFSPPGIEWLYLAFGTEYEIQQCAQAECKAKPNDRFGFCHFEFDSQYDDCKLVDLTIANKMSFLEINNMLESYGQIVKDTAIKTAQLSNGHIKCSFDKGDFEEKLIWWVVYTYAKLLSEQIFVPLNATCNKSILYAPFQTMAQYYISLGYSGIIYGSTVYNKGKNIVLFDKKMALPIGVIEDTIIS